MFGSREAVPGDAKGAEREKSAFDEARKGRINAEIDHEVSILREKASKKRKESAKHLEEAKRLELEAAQMDLRASEMEKKKVA